MNDFNLLCSIGVFNASLMNDAIFKFKRYEDSSLSYTGIEKHLSEDVGGWDTVVRREEYEKLFYNQQATMERLAEEIAAVVEPSMTENEPTMSETRDAEIQFTAPMSESTVSGHAPSEMTASEEKPAPKEAFDCSLVDVGTAVFHAKFGEGKVVKLDKSERYITVAFTVGEKIFAMPNCFGMGFLKLL